MAKRILIPITDIADNCSSYYLVEYKLSTSATYASFTTQLSEIDNYIIISNVSDASTYDIRITRYCCNGIASSPLILSQSTVTDSPQLDPPGTFVLDPGGGSGVSVTGNWMTVTDAVTYIMQVQQGAVFPGGTDFNEYETGGLSQTADDLDGVGITYYGRVKARAPGFLDSEWSNLDSAVAT